MRSANCPVRLFVAESNPIFSELLARAIAKDCAIDILGFSADPSEVLRIVSSAAVDVLLISAHMEEEPQRGLLLLQQLRSVRPALRAVVLLDSSKPAVVVESFRSGACGVFSRSTEIQLLRKCIVAVHSGQIWANSVELSFVLADLAAAQRCQLDGKRLVLLSAREKEVVRYLVVGLTNREIAEALQISRHTVKNYIFKIFDKLGVSNRVELVSQVLSRPADGSPQSNFGQEKAPVSGIKRAATSSAISQDAGYSSQLWKPNATPATPQRSFARIVGSD